MHRFMMALGACFISTFTGSGAEAATWRYAFDVTASTVGYSNLVDTSTGQTVAAGSATYTDFLSAHHAQGTALGQTGRVRFEITTGPETIYSNGFSDGELMSISCLSGFMCDLGDTGFLDGAGVFERLLSGTTVTEERFDPDPGAYLSGLVFDLAADTGRISFANDADVYGSAALNGTVFDWTNPWGQFDVGNFSRTQLIPNPLPAPVFLLGAAALPLVALRRRKMRR